MCDVTPSLLSVRDFPGCTREEQMFSSPLTPTQWYVIMKQQVIAKEVIFKWLTTLIEYRLDYVPTSLSLGN